MPTRQLLNKAFVALFLSSLILFIFFCDKSTKITAPQQEVDYEVTIAKWLDNHPAAVCLNYDTGNPMEPRERAVTDKVLEYGLTMDFELVGKNFEDRQEMRSYFISYLIPHGFGYFGHGYEHINHDALTYDSCYTSFKLTYDIMKKYGLKPVSFAYPKSFGYEDETQLALKNAGFLNGRLHVINQNKNPFILPEGEDDIPNWYALPSVVIEAYEFRQCSECINNNSELVELLKQAIEKRAWLILTFHSIGNPAGYGYYDWDEFIATLQSLSVLDLWVDNMDDITLYIIERQRTKVMAKSIIQENKTKEIQITLSDSLDSSYYDQPLTLLFTLPDDWVGKNIVVSQGDSILRAYRFETTEGKISLKPNEKTYFFRSI